MSLKSTLTILLATLLMAAFKLPAEAKAVTAKTPTVLAFPADLSMGMITFVTNPHGGFVAEHKKGNRALARGRVEIPPGTEISLKLSYEGSQNMQWFQHAHPEAIVRLEINGLPLSDQDIQCLGGLKGLRALDLSDSDMTDAGMQALEGLKNLTTLDVRHTMLTSKGLASVKAFPCLDGLYVSKNKLDDSAIKNISQAHSLRQLNISAAGITDAELGRFAAMPKLIELDLSCNRITDAGLAKLAGSKTLTALNLTDTRVTARGILALSKLKLIKLRFRKSVFSTVELHAIAAAFPNCMIKEGSRADVVPVEIFAPLH